MTPQIRFVVRVLLYLLTFYLNYIYYLILIIYFIFSITVFFWHSELVRTLELPDEVSLICLQLKTPDLLVNFATALQIMFSNMI